MLWKNRTPTPKNVKKSLTLEIFVYIREKHFKQKEGFFMATEFKEIEQTEKKEISSTGCVRGDRGGKGRFDLITPFGLRRVAQHYEGGAKIHDARNWEKGQPIMRFIDSSERHLQDLKAAILLGEQTEDNAAAIVWNMLGYMHTEEMLKIGRLPQELDDRPKPYEKHDLP